VQAAVAGLTPVDFKLTAVIGGPPAVTLVAEPSAITAGGSATLSWMTSGASKVTIAPDVGEVATTGSKVVTPSATTTYVVTATGPGGTSTASTKLVVTARIDAVVNTTTPGAPLRAGTLATIQGANFAAETLTATPPDLPTTLGGTSVVDVEGRLYPLQSVSPTEITFMLSSDLLSGQAEVWLHVKKENGEDSDWVKVELVPVSGVTPEATARSKHKSPHAKPVLRNR
jgi:hypothetical protein